MGATLAGEKQPLLRTFNRKYLFRYDVNARNQILHNIVHLTKVTFDGCSLNTGNYVYPQAPAQLILQTYIMMKEWFVSGPYVCGFQNIVIHCKMWVLIE